MTLSTIGQQFSPPRFSIPEATALLTQYYGVSGTLSPLQGERDQNFRVKIEGAANAVLKISGATEDPTVVDFQVKALDHMAHADPTLGVPKTILNTDGAPYFHHSFQNGDKHLVRLVSFVEGKPLSDSGGSASAIARQIGTLQGRVCKALSAFEHPASAYPIPWNSSSDLMFDPTLLGYLARADSHFMEAVTPHLDPLRNIALPALKSLRHQVIHNDGHTGNILMDDAGAVTGMIDFGDMVHAPLLQDLAVSAASLAEDGAGDLVEIFRDLADGFSSVYPLTADERALLIDAALLRGVLSVELVALKHFEGDNPIRDEDDILKDCITGLQRLIQLKEQRHDIPL